MSKWHSKLHWQLSITLTISTYTKDFFFGGFIILGGGPKEQTELDCEGLKGTDGFPGHRRHNNHSSWLAEIATRSFFLLPSVTFATDLGSLAPSLAGFGVRVILWSNDWFWPLPVKTSVPVGGFPLESLRLLFTSKDCTNRSVWAEKPSKIYDLPKNSGHPI